MTALSFQDKLQGVKNDRIISIIKKKNGFLLSNWWITRGQMVVQGVQILQVNNKNVVDVR